MPSILEVPGDTGFGLDNLPYGVFSRRGEAARRVGVAVGDQVLDVSATAETTDAEFAHLLGAGVLNPLMAAGRLTWTSVRERVRAWLTEPAYRRTIETHLLRRSDVELHLPIEVADFVDFYASEQHARNVGAIFRPGARELPASWKHLPAAYHGRAGTVVVSGIPVRRPNGQRPGARPGGGPTFGPSQRLDVEAEVGFVVGVPSPAGRPIAVDAFAEHVFGVCLVADWSARDIQAWEYVPLGPFLSKSFATSISPWIVPLDALVHARVPPPPRDPQPLPYLRDGAEPWGLDLRMEVRLNGQVVSRPPMRSQYWTPAQQLAHLTISGASVRTGDLYASGTVSGPAPDERGSLLELSWNGAEPLTLPDGTLRAFLEDGDEVTITATAPGPRGARVDFGEVAGRVLPANLTLG